MGGSKSILSDNEARDIYYSIKDGNLKKIKKLISSLTQGTKVTPDRKKQILSFLSRIHVEDSLGPYYDSCSMSWLHYAVFHNQMDIVKYFVDLKLIDIDIQSRFHVNEKVKRDTGKKKKKKEKEGSKVGVLLTKFKKKKKKKKKKLSEPESNIIEHLTPMNLEPIPQRVGIYTHGKTPELKSMNLEALKKEYQSPSSSSSSSKKKRKHHEDSPLEDDEVSTTSASTTSSKENSPMVNSDQFPANGIIDRTALHLACDLYHVELSKFLIHSGANKQLKDHLGLKAEDLIETRLEPNTPVITSPSQIPFSEPIDDDGDSENNNMIRKKKKHPKIKSIIQKEEEESFHLRTYIQDFDFEVYNRVQKFKNIKLESLKKKIALSELEIERIENEMKLLSSKHEVEIQEVANEWMEKIKLSRLDMEKIMMEKKSEFEYWVDEMSSEMKKVNGINRDRGIEIDRKNGEIRVLEKEVKFWKYAFITCLVVLLCYVTFTL